MIQPGTSQTHPTVTADLPNDSFGNSTRFPVPPPSQPVIHSSPSGLVRAMSVPVAQHSAVEFLVHEEMPEVRSVALAHGWAAHGWGCLAITWQEMVYTTDNWASKHAVRSSDVPCPVVDGKFTLVGVPPGTKVVFAIHVGLGCRAPQDGTMVRAEADLWLNNGGKNYEQITK